MGELRARVVGTWQALVVPRRAVPISLVALPLLVAQWWFARSTPALASGVAMCGMFVTVAPAAWRVLFPLDDAPPPVPVVARLALYAAIGAVATFLTGYGVPGLYTVPSSFLTVAPSLAITYALFLVGGWGLGRDIDLEARVERERARAIAAERDKDRAQLLAIRAQLDPHFLFNTLNAIAEWTREDPEVAETAILRLAQMLRVVLDAVHVPAWALAEELSLLDDLLALHEVRAPDRFTVERRGWDAVDGVTVPPMVLLPLVENAMKHGPAAGHRGPVTIAVARDPAHVVVTIENPGPFGGPREGGQGVAMVRRRLELSYAAASLALGPADDPDRTRAIVRLPVGGPDAHG